MKVEQQQSGALVKVGKLLERMKVGMLATINEGRLRSRPMQTLAMDAEGRLWFFTSATSSKVAEAYAHPHEVNISYADTHKQDYLSISGTARLSRDRHRIKALWTPWVKVWFPHGIDDPDLALLCVEIDQAEYWEAPGSGAKRVYGLAKALATGDKSAIGDNEKIRVERNEGTVEPRHPQAGSSNFAAPPGVEQTSLASLASKHQEKVCTDRAYKSKHRCGIYPPKASKLRLRRIDHRKSGRVDIGLDSG